MKEKAFRNFLPYTLYSSLARLYWTSYSLSMLFGGTSTVSIAIVGSVVIIKNAVAPNISLTKVACRQWNMHLIFIHRHFHNDATVLFWKCELWVNNKNYSKNGIIAWSLSRRIWRLHKFLTTSGAHFHPSSQFAKITSIFTLLKRGANRPRIYLKMKIEKIWVNRNAMFGKG